MTVNNTYVDDTSGGMHHSQNKHPLQLYKQSSTVDGLNMGTSAMNILTSFEGNTGGIQHNNLELNDGVTEKPSLIRDPSTLADNSPEKLDNPRFSNHYHQRHQNHMLKDSSYLDKSITSVGMVDITDTHDPYNSTNNQ